MTLVEQILAADPFQRAPDPRNDPELINARFDAMRREYESTRPGLLAWQRDNPTKR